MVLVVSDVTRRNSMKRASNENQENEDMDDGESRDDEDDDDDEEADESEEDVAPKAKRAKVSKSIGASRRASQRSNVGDADDETCIYCDQLFEGSVEIDDITRDLARLFTQDRLLALGNVINVLLKSCGSTVIVVKDDLIDEDEVANKILEVQQMFQKDSTRLYPWVSKQREYKELRDRVLSFFRKLLENLAELSILYDPEQEIIIESIQNWLIGMTSASSRPFRHTSTCISLHVVTVLCELFSNHQNGISMATLQLEGEQKKARQNQARIAGMKSKITAQRKRIARLKALINDCYECVFVHRYRDVDPLIRKNCIQSLNTWIEKAPSIFFETSYLRYLGWVLSDQMPSVRLEVFRTLNVLYKDKGRAAGLRQFTERFRPRIIQVAFLDSDHSVRASAANLLVKFRSLDFLEEAEMQSSSQLIFDANKGVRDYAALLVEQDIKEATETILDRVDGGMSANERLTMYEEDCERVRLSWFKLKAIACWLVAIEKEISSAERDESFARNCAAFRSLADVFDELKVCSACRDFVNTLELGKYNQLATL